MRRWLELCLTCEIKMMGMVRKTGHRRSCRIENLTKASWTCGRFARWYNESKSIIRLQKMVG